MIKTHKMLMDELSAYASPSTKLMRMVRDGKVFPIVRGLYETDGTTPAHLLAGSIYGPSYISFEWALAFHGLIPETVHEVTCACFEKKKKKRYETSFGTFTYRDVPSAAFPFGLEIHSENGYGFRIAGPEKALCDKLYTLHPVGSRTHMEALLTEDLRIDEDSLARLDVQAVTDLARRYHSTNVGFLTEYLRRI